jgi:phosphoribosylaminoimidazole carboxylase PurE protein
MANPLVSIIVGSASDAEEIAPARHALKRFGIEHEAKVLSAHRTPGELVAYLQDAETRGVKLIIAGAGMSAHLGGVVAAHSRLPVLGVPFSSGHLDGMDALLSFSQMPGGVPVSTFGIGKAGAKNAAYQAARILSLFNPDIKERMNQVLDEDKAQILGRSLPEI